MRTKEIPDVSMDELKEKISINQETNCWDWQGCVSPMGYGQICLKNDGIWSMYRAHRVFYTALREKIPKGLVIDHICKNRRCVNPEHLRAVTQWQNVNLNSDSITAKNRLKTHCSKGHEYTKSNTYITKKRRQCLICIKFYTRAANKKRSEKSNRLAARKNL